MTKLPSVAIRRNQAKNDSAPVHSTGCTLVAYTYLNLIGTLTNIFTIPDCRCHGLGRAVALAMAQKLLQKKLPVRSVGDSSNSIAISYHQTLGFKKQCDVNVSYIACWKNYRGS